MKLFLFGLIVISIFQCSCTQWIVEEISLNNGDVVYFKKKSRGSNYGMVAISSNNRRSINPQVDYEFRAIDEILFYKVSNDTLYVLSRLPVENPPEIKEHIKIIQKQYSNQYYHYTLRDRHEELGFKIFPPENE